jgi:hypothetical protein
MSSQSRHLCIQSGVRLKRMATAMVITAFAGLVSMPTVALGATATTLVVTASTSAPTAGTSFSITVTAQDPNGTIDPTYTGTVNFTTSDTSPGVVLPADSQLTNGQGTFAVTLINAYQHSITASDSANSLRGAVNVTVIAAPADHLHVGTKYPVLAGFPFDIVVIANDRYGNIDRSYADRGTVHFTSSDTSPGVVLPADSSVPNGFYLFRAKLDRAGTQTVTATDTQVSSITGTLTVFVRPGPAASLSITAPATATAGQPFDVTVTALDRLGNVASGSPGGGGPPRYAGTVHFTSTDPLASLPPDYTFNALDAGVHKFSNVTLVAPGNQTITASDVSDPSIVGTSPNINVTLLIRL